MRQRLPRISFLIDGYGTEPVMLDETRLNGGNVRHMAGRIALLRSFLDDYMRVIERLELIDTDAFVQELYMEEKRRKAAEKVGATSDER